MVDPTGLEPAGGESQDDSPSNGWGIGEGIGAHIDAHDFPILAEIAAVWPSLGETVQRAVLAYVRACQRRDAS